MQNRKTSGHRLTRKAPLAAMLIWLAAALVLQTAFAILLSASGLFASNESYPQSLGPVLGALVFLLVMRLWYRPDYKGVFRSALSLKKTLLYTLPLVVYSAAVLVYQFIRYDFYWDFSLAKLVEGMAAGFGEEAMLRVALVPIAMGFFKSEKRVWLVPVLTGLVFGFSHLGNIAGGASVANGIIQAVVTTLSGVYFGALLVATGSTVPGIVMHSLYDTICFAGDPSLTEGIMTGTLPASEIVFNLVTTAALMLAGLLILKKVGTPDILRLWKEKWGQD